MRKKKRKAPGFNSFIDIMTCLAGVLILIILLVIIQIQEVKVVIPTPIEHESSKKPVFIECRNDMLYRVDVIEIQRLAESKMEELARNATEGNRLDRKKFMKGMAAAVVTYGPYTVHMQHNISGQIAVTPDPTVDGYELNDFTNESPEDWFGRILSEMDGRREMLTFIVRDDSFFVFKKARALAWVNDIDASWYLLPHDEPLKFGMQGESPMAQ